MSASTNYPTIRPSLLLDFANTEQLDPRISFARPTTATYYDDNTVAKAEQNYVYDSQSIGSSYWTKGNINTTLNATTAPDGTSTASLIVPTTTSAAHYIHNAGTYNGIAGLGVFTYSVYAKSSGYSWVALNIYDNADYYTYFDITNGVVGTNATGNTATITSIGNGWYRCSITRNCATTSQGGSSCIIYACNADNSRTFAGDGTSGVYLWGAQLEQRSTVTAYTPTTTAPITNYIPVLMTAAINEARLDHNPTTRESLGLLIEESRTNLLTYSEQVSGVWSGVNVTATNDVVVSPGGTITGDIVVANTSNAQHRIEYTSAFTSGTAYTLSVYAKAGGYNYVWLRTANDQANVFFNLSNGTVSALNSGSASITPVGNGWYRCTATGTANATGNAVSRINVSNSQDMFAGDGWSGIYLWGMQLEAGSFATSYIPTVASQVTRSADSASMTGSNFSSWYRADEGTVYADYLGGLGSFPSLFTIDNTADATKNRIYAYRNSATATAATNMAAVINENAAATIASGSAAKFAVGYKINDSIIYLNQASANLSSNSVASGANRLIIGGNAPNVRYWNGTIKRLAYYPARLTNAQLQAITS